MVEVYQYNVITSVGNTIPTALIHAKKMSSVTVWVICTPS